MSRETREAMTKIEGYACDGCGRWIANNKWPVRQDADWFTIARGAFSPGYMSSDGIPVEAHVCSIKCLAIYASSRVPLQSP